MTFEFPVPGHRDLLKAANALQIVRRLRSFAGLPACDIARLKAADGLVVYIVTCPELTNGMVHPMQIPRGVDWCDNDIRFGRRRSGNRLRRRGCRMVPGSHLRQRLDVCAWHRPRRGHSLPSILTIHNAAFAGVFDRNRLEALGILKAPSRWRGCRQVPQCCRKFRKSVARPIGRKQKETSPKPKARPFRAEISHMNYDYFGPMWWGSRGPPL
jgi:hypothetical protein